jgi:DNA-binding Xre family transcriptional regulator
VLSTAKHIQRVCAYLPCELDELLDPSAQPDG